MSFNKQIALGYALGEDTESSKIICWYHDTDLEDAGEQEMPESTTVEERPSSTMAWNPLFPRLADVYCFDSPPRIIFAKKLFLDYLVPHCVKLGAQSVPALTVLCHNIENLAAKQMRSSLDVPPPLRVLCSLARTALGVLVDMPPVHHFKAFQTSSLKFANRTDCDEGSLIISLLSSGFYRERTQYCQKYSQEIKIALEGLSAQEKTNKQVGAMADDPVNYQLLWDANIVALERSWDVLPKGSTRNFELSTHALLQSAKQSLESVCRTIVLHQKSKSLNRNHKISKIKTQNPNHNV